MNTIHWKRITALLLVLVLGIGLLASAPADRDELYEDDNEMDRAHWGMAATMKMLAECVDRAEEIPPELYAALMETDVLNPRQLFLVIPGGTSGDWENAVRVWTEARGIIISEEQKEAFRKLSVRITPGKTGLDHSLAILDYGPVVSLGALGRDYVWGAFLICDESLSGSFTREDAAAIAEALDAKDPEILAYEGEALEKLLTLDSGVHGATATYIWSTGMYSAKQIMETVCDSTERMRALFGKIAGKDHMDQDVVMEALFKYLDAQYDLESARFAAEELIPLLEGNGSDRFMDFVRGVVDKDLQKMPAPELTYTDGENQPLKENAKYLVVVERINATSDPVTGCDMIIEAALPAAAVPATPEEADYIIRATVDWDGGKYTQGDLEVWYANVKMAVYDAKTGVMVKDLGRYTQKPTGFMTVSSRVTYLTPYRDYLWGRIAPLFR